MATQQSKGALAGFLPEVSPEAAEANRRYIEAQRKLAETLDVRKNRTFDPMWLAAAKGFLAPTGSGSAFEAFGRVAENLGAAQEKEQELAKTIASQELELAGAELGRERMRQLDRVYEQMRKRGDGGQTTLATGPAGALPVAADSKPALPPSVVRKPTAPTSGGALPAVQAQAQGALPDATKHMFGPTVPMGPPNPTFVTGDEYMMIAQQQGRDPLEAVQKANELDRQRFEVKDDGVFDRQLNTWSPFFKGQEKHQFAYSGRSLDIPSQDAFELNRALSRNDWPTYWQIAKKYGINPPEGAPRTIGATAGAPAGGGAAEPAGAPGARASTSGTPAQPAFRTETEMEADRAALIEYSKNVGKNAADAEAALPKDRDNAALMRQVTKRAQRLIDRAGDAIGIFSNPTFGDAIGTLVAEGISLGPTARISVPAVREAVIRMDRNVTQEQLNARVALMTELANIELLFRRVYLSGQGAVSNMEGEVVARLGGTVEMNADVLRDKMKFVQARSDFDLEKIEAWRQVKNRDPKARYTDWLNSDQYKEIADRYDQKLERIVDESPLYGNSPSSAPQPPATKPPVTKPAATPTAPAGAATPAAPRSAPSSGSLANDIQKKANELRKGVPQ
jgi:hypothetical protein